MNLLLDAQSGNFYYVRFDYTYNPPAPSPQTLTEIIDSIPLMLSDIGGYTYDPPLILRAVSGKWIYHLPNFTALKNSGWIYNPDNTTALFDTLISIHVEMLYSQSRSTRLPSPYDEQFMSASPGHAGSWSFPSVGGGIGLPDTSQAQRIRHKTTQNSVSLQNPDAFGTVFDPFFLFFWPSGTYVTDYGKYPPTWNNYHFMRYVELGEYISRDMHPYWAISGKGCLITTASYCAVNDTPIQVASCPPLDSASGNEVSWWQPADNRFFYFPPGAMLEGGYVPSIIPSLAGIAIIMSSLFSCGEVTWQKPQKGRMGQT